MNIKRKILGGVLGVGYAGYFALGLFYMSAIGAGLQEWLGLWFIFANLIGLIITTTMPLIGAIVAIMGAMRAWGWSFLYSVAIFIAIPTISTFIIGLILNASSHRWA